MSYKALFIIIFSNLTVAVSATEPVDYLGEIKPLLQRRCFACHGALKQSAGLRLDAAKLLIAGGESGRAIIPGSAQKSLLMERVTSSDEADRMPPEGEPLTVQQQDLLRKWIDQGAQFPASEQPEQDPRLHWAFIPLKRIELPVIKNSDWKQNPIDQLIAAKHEQHQLLPLPTASKEILLRRVSLDLTGLPPTQTELHDFLKDKSETAYEKVVDRLLSSPHYGERWGRHWMDIWRYSDWYGRRKVNDVRNSYPHIWRWRDWIIKSLNDDKGYHQMVREMLAADELYPEDDTVQPALGFIVRNWFALNYDTWKKDLVEHTGKAFLGLRMNCAHCHDHKYDPISQEEYFQFRAFFEPIELRHDSVPGGPLLKKYIRYKPGSGASLKPVKAALARVYDHDLNAKTYMYRLGDARDRFDRPPVQPGVPEFLGGKNLEINSIELPPTAWNPGLKPFIQQAETKQKQAELQQAKKHLQTVQSERKKQLPSLKQKLQQNEQALSIERKKNRLTAQNEVGYAIAGWQSLLQDGTKGRSILQHSLSNLKKLNDQSAISFRLNIVQDSKITFQLARNLMKGHTAFFVGLKRELFIHIGRALSKFLKLVNTTWPLVNNSFM